MNDSGKKSQALQQINAAHQMNESFCYLCFQLRYSSRQQCAELLQVIHVLHSLLIEVAACCVFTMPQKH
jgi:hypothetical protein